MADLPFDLAGPGLAERFFHVVDAEGKIPRALEALGPLAGRDVVLVDAADGRRARQLVRLGARLTALERPGDAPDRAGPELRSRLADIVPPERIRLGTAADLGLPDATADVIVACWSAFRGPDHGELHEAERVLRPDGRLLVLHDYGRDEAQALRPEGQAQRLAWSRRDGPFLGAGFKIRVIHCWWTFASLEEAAVLLGAAFGDRGVTVAAALRRPRLSYNVAVYHRDRAPASVPQRAVAARA